MRTRNLLISIFLIILAVNTRAQECVSGGCSLYATTTPAIHQYPSGTFTTTASTWTTVSSAMNGGNWTLFSVTSGYTYEWTYCEDYGGVSTAWDSELTLFKYSNGNVLCYSDDYCGSYGKAPYISWTANFNGTVQLLTSVYSCNANGPSGPYNKLVWRRISSGQGGCTNWSVSPSNQTVTSSGGSYSATVSASGTCSYNLTFPNSWIVFDGYGTNGVFNYIVDDNSGADRIGYIYINDATSGVNRVATLTISQAAMSCSYSISPSSNSIGSGNGNGVFSVSTQTGCNWTASSNNYWITITAGSSGTGSGTVSYTVTSNPNTSSRTGSITVTGGNTYTITQTGQSCNYTISPNSNSFGSGNGNGDFSVSTQSGCNWSASSNNYWITITTGSSGTGNGTVGYAITSNTNTSQRIGTITITGGNTFTIIQSGTTTSPDLIINTPSVNIFNLVSLSSTQITYTIQNIGNGVAGISTTSFFLSTNNSYNVGIDKWIKDDVVPSIAATGSTTRTVTVSIPENTVSGNWYIIMIANATNAFSEFDNSNNSSFVSVNINTSISCTDNTFPFGDGTFPCDVAGDPWGMNKYQCVSYVSWKVNEFFGETSTNLPVDAYPFNNFMHGYTSPGDCYTVGNGYRLGNACHWAPILAYHGVTVNSTPSVGSIAWWDGHTDPNINGAGENGHVAYVSSVSGSMVCITEYNWGTNYKCKFNYRTLDLSLPNAFGNRIPDNFIHIEASGLGSGPTGTFDISNTKPRIKIYPNPANEEITIETMPISYLQNERVTLYDMKGQLQKQQMIQGEETILDIRGLMSGLYIITIESSTGIETHKFVKQ